MAQEWQLKVDLGRQLKFPDTITVATLRPEIVWMSETSNDPAGAHSSLGKLDRRGL